MGILSFWLLGNLGWTCVAHCEGSITGCLSAVVWPKPVVHAAVNAGVGEQGICKSQESKLAVLWTVGIFALNCGPVIMGFVLDFLGPKFTGILGA